MEEIHTNSDNEVVIKDQQQGDEDTEETKSADEPAGASTVNSNTAQTQEQDKVEDDEGFDQVDAAPAMINQPGPVRIAQLQYSRENQPAVEEHKGTNSEVPKIEVTVTNTQSNSSSEEDSTGSGEQDDEESKDELKDEVNTLRRENETMKNTIDNLKREKSSLEENFEEERSKIEKFRDQLRREKDDLLNQRTQQSSDLGSSAAVVKEEDELTAQLKQKIAQLQGDIETLKQSLDNTEKKKEEVMASSEEAAKGYKNKIKELETENKDKDRQLEETSENLNSSLTSLHYREKATSSLQEENDLLKSQVSLLEEEATKAQLENSRLQNKLRTTETHSSHQENAVQRLKNDITNLQEKNKLLEKKGSEIEQKVTQEVQRKLRNRIRELEEKVVKVNEEKKKIKADYDEAVKALEAVDKVYSVRENTLEKYKADYEEATDKIKENEKEIATLKSDLSKNKEKLTRALEYKADREELKDHLRKSKEAIALQREETEQVRQDLDEERHGLKMAQARAQERGRKIQVLNLELTEVKDTLQIARNVIDEKENNMKSLRESLEAEKERKAKLEKELEIVPHLEKKLQFTEEEKLRFECRLNNTELELKETQTSLQQAISIRREMDQNVDNLERDKKHLNGELEEKRGEIANLNERIKEQDQEIDSKLMEIVQMADSMGDLRDQLEDVLTSYHNDREWWKQRADKVLGRRPKSAPPRRRPGNEFPNGGMSLSSRRLMNRMGAPRLNQSYIDSRRKVTRQRPGPTDEEQAPKVTTKENEDVADGSPGHMSAPETSPRPPSTPPPGKPRSKRPASSYGIRSHSPLHWSRDDEMLGAGYYSDMGPVTEETGFNGYDADDEVVSSCAVHKGDKVMIQSKISGEEKMNITGLVKYVGTLGSSTFVGLKLDQPVGNTSGRLGGREYFLCPRRYGRVVRLSDIHAVMNPRTRNYSRIRPMTFD